jgi:hypothetical protein
LDKRSKLKKMAMRFGTWNVRSMYRAGSLRAVAEEMVKYKFGLGGYMRSGLTVMASHQQEIIDFSIERGMKIID